jgi:hypothetical protein
VEQIIKALPFGQHKGQPLEQVPSGYLLYLARGKLSSGLRLAIGDELRRRNVEAPAAPGLPKIPNCSRCGNTLNDCRWQEDRAGRKSIRVECRWCHMFLAFAPLIRPFTEEADRNASSAPVLDVLTRLEALGVGVQSDGKSCWLRWEDEARVPPEVRSVLRQCSHRLAALLGKNIPR